MTCAGGLFSDGQALRGQIYLGLARLANGSTCCYLWQGREAVP